MFLSDVSIRRPVLATVFSMLLIVFGIISFERLPVREYPDIDPPVVSVEARYPGAAAAVVETRVTQIVEDAISGIEGIRSIDSESRDGISEVTVEFFLDRDLEAAVNDIRDRVSRILDNLPDEADPPEIFKVDSNSNVIMWLNLVSNRMDGLELTDYAERYLVDRFSVLDGVARVFVGGARRFAMRIWLDRQAMAAQNVTVADVEQALQNQNVELPAGRVESTRKEFTVRVTRLFKSAEDFGRLVIRQGRDGHLTRLRDVALVERGAEDDRSVLRGNRIPMVGLGIVRQSKANTLDVAQAAKKEAAQVNETLPEGMQLIQSYDTSVFIEASILEVYKTLAITAVLVVAVLFLFLGSLRATLVPAVTVPVSLIATFAVLSIMDFTINLLTLLAMILAIGMVVDDAIVVLENIFRRIQLGEPPLLAAIKGARQVGFAVVATTLVLVAVFVPITFMQGNTGRLFSEFAIALAGAVCISSLVALTLSPMMCSRVLKPKPPGISSKQSRLTSLHKTVAKRYSRLLIFLMQYKWISVLIFAIILGSTPLFYTLIDKEYAPLEDRGAFFVIADGPEGASFEKSYEMLERMEEVLMPLYEKGEATRVLLRLPASFSSTNEVNSVRGIVVLSQWAERNRSMQEIMQDVNRKLKALPGYRAFSVARRGLGGGTGKPVEFVLGGSDYDELARWRDILIERAAENNGLSNLESDYKENKPQLEVIIDKDRAADVGVSIAQIGRTLETMLGFRQVTTYIDRGEEYDVIIEGKKEQKRTPTDIRNIYVRSETGRGELIPLSSLLSLKEFADSAAKNRFNRLRAITLSATLQSGYLLGDALAYLEKITREELGSAPVIDFKGQSREFVDASRALVFAFGLSLLVVFLVLAAQFESFVHPFTIMLTVPLAVAGALMGLYLAGSSLNVYSQVGILVLIGLAAKNGILIVEFANQLRNQGKSVSEAVLESARTRLRPVLMTSVSTAIGAVPLVLASGAGAESRFTIGIVIISGVVLSTVLTLFLVPLTYSFLAKFTSPSNRIDREIKALEQNLMN
ncbi:MAG: efflux RND transporter permease subunit [Desulfobacterales bacterium]|jgi:multidrug efflux pump